MPHIAFISNSAWNIAHFRKPILESLLARGDRITVIAPADGSEANLYSRGIEFEPLAFRPSATNPFHDLKLLADLRGILRGVKPDAVLTFTVKPNIYGSMAAHSLGIPSIPTISGLGTSFLSGRLMAKTMRFLFRFALRRSRKVIFQNDDDRDLFTSGKIVEWERTRVVAGSGIDLSAFRPSPMAPPEPFTFLQIGRLLGDKGIRECIEAARILRAEGHSFRFCFLGEMGAANPSAVPRDEILSAISDGVIEHQAPTLDVRPFIRDAHAVVLASYREGLPRSLLEGAAMGRMLVATDVPGCRDLVVDGANGYLCEPRSAESLAGALRKALITDAEKMSAFGLRSRHLAELKYDQRFVSSAYLEELARIA